MSELWEVLEHTLHDTVYLLPILFLSYLLMEYLEHKLSPKQEKTVQRLAQYGPLFGGLAGILPQCGFSSVASNLYAGRIITVGTLLSVFLATSDEMLVILISSGADTVMIVTILLIKLIAGSLSGLVIDRLVRSKQSLQAVHELCQQDHCHCENNHLLLSAVRHSASIFLFLFVISAALTFLLHLMGEDVLAGFILNKPFIGELLAGIIGLIPNCAASVALTKLYLEGGTSFAAMMSGLFAGSGVGLLVLFRENRKHWKENLQITALLYVVSVAIGWGITLLSVIFGT